MNRPKPVSLDTHAAATLQYIRDSMDAAVSLSIPGSAGIAMGSVGVIAAAIASTSAFHPYWFWIWIGAAALAASLGALRMARQSVPRGSVLSGTPVRRFMLGLFPGLFAGAVMTAVLRVTDNDQFLPASWLVLYGCALIAASVPTTRALGVLGLSFVGLGLLCYALAPAWHMLVLGAGFGGLHLAFGLLARRAA